MNIFKTIFGSSEVISKGMEMAEEAVFTDQEKSEYQVKLLSAYDGYKVAQRLISLTFCIPYALAWLITFILSFKIDVTVQQGLLDGEIKSIVYMIAIFYFGGGATEGVVRTINSALKTKKGDSNVS